ncbi:nucleoside recognition domain-containing protein [Sedimentibacter sp. MB31-C6]|uniref:nucleoside recognition domain-containing protein n=1 Tax=Sedimentibacter sp. MB31-C6 TaxID=3109366 RepID=UPI002DDCCBE2|nr:nucleoside recognition domain-containing protein [Sedimentibacter sp. MB36-C1]WSI04534.1 nucleoside recognition domain-containing protein [Sedimentibacter sp. MB36-C1]
MRNIWFGLIGLGLIFSFLNNKPEVISNILFYDIQKSVDLILSLVSIMAFWTGMMRIVEKSGILNKIAYVIRPLIKFLFKDIQNNSLAVNAIIMTIAANFLGMGNSATALGIKAMQEIQKTNKNKKIATNSMCMLLIINISSIQLLPLSIIKIRAEAGAVNPTDIIMPTLLATTFSTIIAVVFAKYYERI